MEAVVEVGKDMNKPGGIAKALLEEGGPAQYHLLNALMVSAGQGCPPFSPKSFLI